MASYRTGAAAWALVDFGDNNGTGEVEDVANSVNGVFHGQIDIPQVIQNLFDYNWLEFTMKTLYGVFDVPAGFVLSDSITLNLETTGARIYVDIDESLPTYLVTS